MRLCDLSKFHKITIQCHDNPDADALASGFGLFCYFSALGIETRLVYSGKNTIQKANIRMMVEKLNIPLEYIPRNEQNPYRVEGLLITVDGQYGAGNVTTILADEVAVIDHHKQEPNEVKLTRVESDLGSCSTLVWKMLKEADYQGFDKNLSTALYYGLYMDTGMFAEIYHPEDMDMRDTLDFDKNLITRLRNSNLSLQELEIAGIAMIRTSYNSDYRFAMIHAQKCDPNIMGIISDFLLQVDEVDTCVVFNEEYDGYKFSVRSCVEEVNANELAAYLAQGIGSGGGHSEKAGGFINMKMYDKAYPTMNAEGYFNNRMTSYFDAHEILYTDNMVLPIADMQLYREKQFAAGYVHLTSYFEEGSIVTIRTGLGDRLIEATEGIYIVFGWSSLARVLTKEQFESRFIQTQDAYEREDWTQGKVYVPRLKSQNTKKTLLATECAKVCMTKGDTLLYAKKLDKAVKVFSPQNQGKYVLGRPGDYLTVRKDNLSEVTVMTREALEKGFERMDVKNLPISQ